MQLSKRVTVGLSSLLSILVISVVVSLYSTVSLSNLLKFITTTAWDTADGAMEGSIGIEAQMLAVERITAGRGESVGDLLKDGEAMADEALNRMIKAGLISKQEIDSVNEDWSGFNSAKANFLQNYQNFVDLDDQLHKQFAELQSVMVEAEEIGDGTVEELEANPNFLLSWSGGLSEKWEAADGMMESQIFFLSTTYYYERFLQSGASSESEKMTLKSLSELKEKIDSVSSLDIFKKSLTNVPGFEGQSFASILPALLPKLEQSAMKTLLAYKTYQAALSDYQAASDKLLETIEDVEESADSKVEGQASAVSFTTSLAYTLCGVVLVLGAAVGLFARHFFSVNVVKPIEQLTENMAVTAKGGKANEDQLDHRDDEIGAMAKALKTFIRLFEDIRRVSDESFRNSKGLEVASTSILLADGVNNIIFANDAFDRMLEKRADELANLGINLKVGDAKGKHFDLFKLGDEFTKTLSKNDAVFEREFDLGGLRLSLTATPIVDGTNRLGTVIEVEDLTDEFLARKKELETSQFNARIRKALDNVSSSVMLADADRNIIYLNKAVVETLKAAEKDIKKDLPRFDVDKLLGASIDTFHKNPSHQKGMLEKLNATHSADIVVGGRHMNLILSPVIEGGSRLGTVVEWQDKTFDVRTENEVNEIVERAGNGDFSPRISSDGKEGFYAALAVGLNSLMEKTESFVDDMAMVFDALSKGDLNSHIQTDYDGALSTIKTNANATIARLSDVVSDIRKSTASVESAAQEIAAGNADLSQRTEEQASSLEETASSMEEMTSAVKNSSDSATEANKMATDARKIAQDGGQVVDQAVGAMGEILKASNRINDIIGVIDEIAFQTNLLALNAAVEAARAGEQGRGFAVVAGEVRSLSQRSAAAAKEIKDLIKDSVVKVEAGSSLVNESGKTLNSIVAAVEKVATRVSDIATSAYEQRSGIDQINTAISQMDEMTQQNAALVEQAAASSQSMREQAVGMARKIEFFRVGGDTVASSSEPIVTFKSKPVNSRSKAKPSAPAAGSDDEWEDF